jgi:hypothetical protein
LKNKHFFFIYLFHLFATLLISSFIFWAYGWEVSLKHHDLTLEERHRLPERATGLRTNDSHYRCDVSLEESATFLIILDIRANLWSTHL